MNTPFPSKDQETPLLGGYNKLTVNRERAKSNSNLNYRKEMERLGIRWPSPSHSEDPGKTTPLSFAERFAQLAEKNKSENGEKELTTFTVNTGARTIVQTIAANGQTLSEKVLTNSIPVYQKKAIIQAGEGTDGTTLKSTAYNPVISDGTRPSYMANYPAYNPVGQSVISDGTKPSYLAYYPAMSNNNFTYGNLANK